MRRYASTLIFIVILAVAAGLGLGFQTISVGNFERGGETLLGLSLGLDLQGGSHLVYQVDQDKLPVNPITGETVQPTSEQMDALLSIIERRVNSAGLGEPILQLLGDDRLLIQLPGIRDPGRAKALIGETASLIFKHRVREVEREIPGLTSAEVISFQIGTILPEGELDEAGLPPFRAGDTKDIIPLVPEPEPTPEAEATPDAEATPSADETPTAEGTPSCGEDARGRGYSRGRGYPRGRSYPHARGRREHGRPRNAAGATAGRGPGAAGGDGPAAGELDRRAGRRGGLP